MLRQYREEGFVCRAGRVSQDAYSAVLDSIVVCCVDCAVVHRGRLLLGLRTQHPYRGWWVLGGRMWPGESPEMTAQRVVAHEAGVRITDLSRFVYIDSAFYVWRLREQHPQDHGCHMQGNNFFVVMTDAERAEVQNRSGGFAKLRWAKLETVLADESIHPSIRFLADTARRNCA